MATSQDVLLFLCLERALYMAKILAHTSGHRQYTSCEQVEIYRVHTPHARALHQHHHATGTHAVEPTRKVVRISRKHHDPAAYA